MSEPKTKAHGQSRWNIEVTEKDIAKAKRNDSYVCVVSQAIARAIPDSTRIETDTQTIRFTRNGERYVFLTPYAVAGYVIAFDAGDPIRPFSFQLRNPIQAKRKRFTAVGQKLNRARTRARRAVHKKAKAAGLFPDAPEVQAEARQAAIQAYAEASQQHPGEPLSNQTGARMPPKVFKRKERSYGHRLLRINQKAALTPTTV